MSEYSPHEIDKLDTPNARKKGGPLTPEQKEAKQQRFLKVYRETANVKASCKSAGISRQTFYNWRDSDESFNLLLIDAEEDANDTLEYAAYDRGVLGVVSYVISQGKMVYEEIPALDDQKKPMRDEDGNQIMRRGKPLVERKYSDSLLITRMKARMPDKYKDKQQVDHSVLVTGVGVYLPEKNAKGDSAGASSSESATTD